MQCVVIHVVVVANVERGARTRSPTGKKLRAHARVERVVVDDRAREIRLRKLVRAAPSPDVHIKRRQTGIVTYQALLIETDRSAKLICRLERYGASYLEQISRTRILRRKTFNWTQVRIGIAAETRIGQLSSPNRWGTGARVFRQTAEV